MILKMIQCLEAVDVSEHHGTVVARVATHLRMATLQAVKEKAPVGQIGERVMQRVVSEFLFGAHALGHITVDDDQFLDFPRSFLMVLAVDSRIRQPPFLWRKRYCRSLPTPVARASRDASRTLKRSSG